MYPWNFVSIEKLLEDWISAISNVLFEFFGAYANNAVCNDDTTKFNTAQHMY